MSDRDTTLAALLRPLQQQLLAIAPGASLFLGARAGTALQAIDLANLVAVQPFRPWAAELEAIGIPALADIPEHVEHFSQVLLLPPRQREDARAQMATALAHCRPGGWLLAAAANDEGAKSIESDFRKLLGHVDGQLSKHHCRVFWARKDSDRADIALQAHWQAGGDTRSCSDTHVPSGHFLTRPGIFAWNRVDPGSALLAEHLPVGLTGRAADLGAGWGFLSAVMLARNPALRALSLFEADARALSLARRNLPTDTDTLLDFHWHDVGQGLPAGAKFDFIFSNPPFHATGKSALPEIGIRFITVAAQNLSPTGQLLLVANAHLPYENALMQHFEHVRTRANAHGYKVLEAHGVRR